MKIISKFFASILTLSSFASIVNAQTTIVVSDPQRRFPIALPQLCLAGGESPATRDIPRIVSRDLDLSGYFDVLNPASYIEAAGKCGDPSYSDWQMIRAQWLVRGTVTAQGPRMTVQLALHDVPSQRVVFGKEYSGDVGDITKIAHKFANEIMREITGEGGPFGSSIAFSGRIGRFKDLFVMDMDGSNIKQLTNDRGLSLSPNFNQSGDQLLYTSYRNRVPDLFIFDLVSGRSKQITKNASLEVGGAFVPGSNLILSSLTEDRDSDLVLFNQDGSINRRITPPNRAIDVSPSFSPDGSQITFCSDRGGRPQIYTMSASGGEAKRISFVTSNYCTSPTWSPKGDRIAFVCRSDGGFQLFVTESDGSNPIQLTGGGDNEDPSWSPDGRYLAYSTTSGKKGGFNVAMMRVVRNLEGTGISLLTSSRGDDTEPSWGPLPDWAKVN